MGFSRRKLSTDNRLQLLVVDLSESDQFLNLQSMQFNMTISYDRFLHPSDNDISPFTTDDLSPMDIITVIIQQQISRDTNFVHPFLVFFFCILHSTGRV